MKKILLFTSLVLAAQLANAQSFTQSFTGNFTDGDLSGFSIEGLFEIETDGQSSGTADLTGVGPEILEFTFEVFDLSTALYTDFIEADDLAPLATFDTIAPATEPQVTTFDFFGTNFSGESLDFFYDAFASNPATGIAISFDDGFGNISNATVNLVTAVPEQSSFAAILGAFAIVSRLCSRRRIN